MAGDLIGMDYHGDAAQGLGSNAGISAPDQMPELKHINETIKNIMLLDNERNLRIFGQKVQDRDKLTNQILANQVSTGELSPDDQKYFDNAKGDVEKAFTSWGGNWNDTAGFRKYQDSVNHLQEIAGHSQTRWAMMKQLEQQKASETLPFKQKQIQDFIDKENKKGFWDHIDPYQQMFSYDHDRMNNTLLGSGMTTEGAGGVPEFGTPAPVTDRRTTKTSGGKTTVTDTQTSAPSKQTSSKGQSTPMPGSVPQNGLPPLFSTSKKFWDYDAIQKRATTLQIQNGEDAENQNQWLNLVEGYDETGKKKFIDAMNQRIAQYNSERGFADGQRGFVNPVQLVQDKNGVSRIKEPAADFAAKTALAGIDGNYAATEYRFDKDAAKFRIDEEKNKLTARKIGVEGMNAQTKRMAVNLKLRQAKDLDNEAKASAQVWDDVHDAIQIPAVPVTNFGNTETTDRFKVNVDDLPEGFTYTAGVNSKGQPIQLRGKDSQPVYGGKDGKQIVGYKGGYFDADYFMPTANKNIKLSSQELFDAYAKSGGRGSFKDWITNKFKAGQLDYQLEGANGKANRVSSYISQKAMGNKLTKKGQSDPYGADEQDLIDLGDNTDNE